MNGRSKSLVVSRFSGVFAASRADSVEIRYSRVATESAGYYLSGAVSDPG